MAPGGRRAVEDRGLEASLEAVDEAGDAGLAEDDVEPRVQDLVTRRHPHHDQVTAGVLGAAEVCHQDVDLRGKREDS